MGGFLEGFKFIFRGGFMMIPLLASSLIALTVIIERWKAFHKRYVTPPGFINDVLEKARAGKLLEAIQACHGKDIPVAAVLKAGLEHFKNPTEEMEIAIQKILPAASGQAS